MQETNEQLNKKVDVRHICAAHSSMQLIHWSVRTHVQHSCIHKSLDVFLVVIVAPEVNFPLSLAPNSTEKQLLQVRASLAARSPTNSPHLAPYFIR